jgi:LysR family glycine cleavage system transcriptional activator
MKPGLPPLHTLRAFEAIGRLGSFTLAAQELDLTHSAISHQMRALETSLQAKLVDRSRRELSLTASGQQFLPVVRTVLQQLTEVSDAIRGPTGQRLRVNVLPSFAARWLLPRLGGFLARRPDVDVEVSATQELVELRPSGMNLAIRHGDGKWQGVTSELLFEETLFPVASPAYLRAHRIETLGDLRTGLLLRDDFQPWEPWLEHASIRSERCRFGAVYRDSALALQAAEAGQGIALGRSWLVADAIKAGSLARIGPFSTPASAAYFLVYPKGGRTAPAVRDFCSWIRNQGELS